MEQILPQVTTLLHNRNIFLEVQKIIKANPSLLEDGVFIDWMTTVYVGDALMGIRRQLDLDNDSISLVRLLREVKQYPEVLSRDRYIKLHAETPVPDGLESYFGQKANRNFDKCSEPDKAHIDPSLVEVDLTQLKNSTKRLKRFANKRIAHFDRNKFKDPPTFSELYESLDLIEQILKKYLLFLHGGTYIRISPTIIPNWTAIFRQPWIIEKEEASLSH